MVEPRTYNRSTGRVAFEHCATLGPVEIGQAYTGGIRPWVSRIDGDGGLHLYVAQTPGVYTEVEGELPATINGSRHNIAFDQSGRAYLSYLSDSGIVVRQYDTISSDFIERGPFTGLDPVLFNDYFVGLPLGESDVILFYLSMDRLSIKCRLQRDFFAVEYDVYTLPEAHNMDRVGIGYLRYQLWLADVNDNKLYLTSGVYPYIISDAMSGDIVPTQSLDVSEIYGVYRDDLITTSILPYPVIESSDIFETSSFESMTGVMMPITGADGAQLYIAPPVLELLRASMIPNRSIYTLTILNQQTVDELLRATMTPIRSIDRKTT